MAGTLVKSVMLKIVANDGDSEAKLDEISRKADELAKKHPDLKVKVDTAAASAKLAVLKRELKDTADESGNASINLKSFGTALASVASGGLSGGISEMSMMQKVMLGLNFATGLGEPLMAGLTVAVGGLSAGLVAAGAGAGVFGAVVKSTFSGLATNITAATAAEDKMAGARTMKGFTADTKAFNLALKNLDGPQKQLVIGAANAESGWHSFVKSAGGGVASVVVPALKMVPQLLQAAHGFLGPVESGLRSIVTSVGHGLDSTGFKSFLGMLQKQSGGDLTKLATAAGHVAEGLGGIIKSFLPYAPKILSDVDGLTGKFAKWGDTLSGHSGFKSLMQMFKTETPLAVGVLKNLGGVIKNVVGAMTGLSTFSNGKAILQVLGPLSGILDKLTKNKGLVNIALYALAGFDALKKLSNGITGVSNAFSAMKSAGSLIQGVATKLGILKAAETEAAGATEEETVAQGELDTAMDANPIGLIILAVAGLVIAIVELWKHSTGFRNFWKGAWKDIEKAAVDAWHFIDNDMIHPLEHGIDDVVNFVRSHWKLLAVIIATVLLGPIAGLVVFIATNWSKIKALTSRLISDVTGFFKRLPGNILGALSGLASMLFNAGKNAIMGFIDGAKSLLGDVLHIGESIGSSLLHGAESFLHIGSPSKVMYQRGIWAGQGFEFGLRDSVPGIAQQATRLAGAAVPSGGARAGGAGGGGAAAQPIIIQFTGDLAGFRDMLMNTIRVSGGDPRVVQRKVVFR